MTLDRYFLTFIKWVNNCFVLGRDISHCVKKKILVLLKRPLKTDIIKMLKFFIDDIFDMFGGRVDQPTVGIPVDTNCTSNLFLYLYQTYFNFTFCYIDDVISLKHSKLGDHRCIYVCFIP